MFLNKNNHLVATDSLKNDVEIKEKHDLWFIDTHLGGGISFINSADSTKMLKLGKALFAGKYSSNFNNGRINLRKECPIVTSNPYI